MNRLKLGGAKQRSLFWAILHGALLSSHYNVYDFGEATRIKHISTNLQNKEAKIGWLCNRTFMLMISKGASINSINFCNRDAVKNDFDNLMLVMEKHNLVERQIFNVDKTWLSNVPEHSKSLETKGQKQVVHALSICARDGHL